MIKMIFPALLVLFVISGCAKKQNEDLVLIEFAARLEEDYHKMHPIEKSAQSNKVMQVDVDGKPLDQPPASQQYEHHQ